MYFKTFELKYKWCNQSANVSSHIIYCYFPLSNPSFWLWARQLFQLLALLWSGQRWGTPSRWQDQVQLFPFPSSHSPHRRMNTSFFLGLDSPVSTYILETDYSMLPSFKHCPIQYLVDRPKVAALRYSSCPSGEPGPCFSSSKITPSPQDSVVNKNTRSRYRGSQRD